jgi:hypothetical protein
MAHSLARPNSIAYIRSAGEAVAAQVAQLVEQRTENPRVGGSNPPLGTILFSDLSGIRLSGREG